MLHRHVKLNSTCSLQAYSAIFPTLPIAHIIGGLTISMGFLFSGLFIPRAVIPGFWLFAYYAVRDCDRAAVSQAEQAKAEGQRVLGQCQPMTLLDATSAAALSQGRAPVAATTARALHLTPVCPPTSLQVPTSHTLRAQTMSQYFCEGPDCTVITVVSGSSQVQVSHRLRRRGSRQQCLKLALPSVLQLPVRQDPALPLHRPSALDTAHCTAGDPVRVRLHAAADTIQPSLV